MFDWEDLRHFAAFSRAGSLSAAARELRVDHVTVARRIAALEAALGAKLVDRRPRAYVLTAEGGDIAAMAERMMQEAFSVERAAKGGVKSLSGLVTISAPPVAAARLIAARLGAFYEAYPGVELRLMADLRMVSLGRREADIAVRLTRPTGNALTIKKVGLMRFGVYGTAAHVARPKSARVFIGYDFSLEGTVQQQWLDAVRGNRPVVMRSNDIGAQAEAAGAGVGMAVLPDFIGAGTPGLSRLKPNHPMQREVWLAVHRDLRRVPAVKAVLEFLTDCFEDL